MPAARPMPPRRASPPEPIETRFVLWFNGNGIIEKYWIPREDGRDYEMTPCLQPLARFRNDIHVLSGVDNPAARLPGPGNGHHNSMSGLVAGAMFSGRGRRRPVDRPGDRPEDRQRQPLPLACRSASARSRSARASSAT